MRLSNKDLFSLIFFRKYSKFKIFPTVYYALGKTPASLFDRCYKKEFLQGRDLTNQPTSFCATCVLSYKDPVTQKIFDEEYCGKVYDFKSVLKTNNEKYTENVRKALFDVEVWFYNKFRGCPQICEMKEFEKNESTVCHS